jgi:acyl-CoA synthetase (AMP-forming)/AMP-acid ligase II
MFDAQVRLIRDAYAIEPGEIDLPLLPIFALFAPALGLTSVIPDFDPSRPASLSPERIVAAIRQEKVTMSFGSPTLWRKIFDHCLSRNLTLPSIRRVLCAGAPVPASMWEDASRIIPNGQLHSPYGATEMLPVATVSSREYENRPGHGALVGRPLAANRVRVIRPVRGLITTLADAVETPAGEIGEIIATGPTMTKEYDARPDATAAAKIADGKTLWHRLGDAGRLDPDGRLWFCGRLAERVETVDGIMDTEPCEQFFRDLAGVRRCALIGLGPAGRQEPALVVEPTERELAGTEMAAALRNIARAEPLTASIRKYYFHAAFPVDVRHNAKIHRLALARWAITARYWEPADP